MLRLVEAGAAELVALLAARGELTLPTRVYSRLLTQVALSESYAVLEGDAVLALAGIAPVSGVAGEIWFGVKPNSLGRNLLPIVRLARQVIERRRSAYPAGLFCMVREGHRPGERLAAAIGCVPVDCWIEGAREWRYWPDGVPCKKAGHERPAADAAAAA